MRGAPSVSYPVGRSFWALVLLGAAWLAGAAAIAAWGRAEAGPPWRLAGGGAVLLVTGAWAGWSWLRTRDRMLAWDGTAWSASGIPAAALDVACVLDLQLALLLRVRAGRDVHWLWVERSRSPARWRELRRAVYSRARPDALDGVTPPTAKP